MALAFLIGGNKQLFGYVNLPKSCTNIADMLTQPKIDCCNQN